jgi:hypothetical protein
MLRGDAVAVDLGPGSSAAARDDDRGPRPTLTDGPLSGALAFRLGLAVAGASIACIMVGGRLALRVIWIARVLVIGSQLREKAQPPRRRPRIPDHSAGTVRRWLGGSFSSRGWADVVLALL